MGTFLAETEKLHTHGEKMIGLADDFGYAHRKIKETVKLIAEAYPSKDGRDIAARIQDYDSTIDAMEDKLRRHGQWGQYSSRTTTAVSEEISSDIAGKL